MFETRFKAGIKLAEGLIREGIENNTIILCFSEKGEVVAKAIKTMVSGNLYLVKNNQDKVEIQKNKTIVIVDDGSISLNLLETIIKFLREVNPKQIAIALPIFDKEKTTTLKKIADKVIVLHQPDIFMGVGEFYQEDKSSPEYQLKVLK